MREDVATRPAIGHPGSARAAGRYGKIRKATSFHGLNSDRGLSVPGRGLWLLLNWLNNSFPSLRVDPGLRLKRFPVEGRHLEKAMGAMAANSPARVLSDLFWLSMPWGEIAGSLGGEVRALEIGCGSGRYGRVLADCLGSHLASYTGIDINAHPEWEAGRRDPRFRLEVGDSAALPGHLGNANLIITQSALEHFDEDLTFFRQVAEMIDGSERPVMQIHLMPSAACLSTYLWHGVRQYTPRTISKATSLFDSRTRKTLFSLGSSACNRVHRRFITYPGISGNRDLRNSRKAEYQEALRGAIARDQEMPGGDEACFYALVLESGRADGLSCLDGQADH